MTKDSAIIVKNVSKTFKIPHEKVTSLRGAAVSVFRKKSFEEFKALDDVSFEVKKGEFFGIIGRNGSGKSTLLKILAGIYRADKGNVQVNGLISPFLELGIGFNPELSGRDNIYLNATVLGLSKREIDEKFDSIVRFSELERFIDQKLKNYSSGMQVRLAFSVAIHANREILLMDEVLAVGDSNFQRKCLTEFKKYRDMGKTVILVTHDMDTIKKYCDKALFLLNGKIHSIGAVDAVTMEYLYQNMTDEEKRLLREREVEKKDVQKQNTNDDDVKKASHDRLGNGDIVVTAVIFCDKYRKEKNVFKPFEDIVLKIQYKKKNRNIKKAVFGIEILNNAGYKLYGFNSGMSEDVIPLKNDIGSVEFLLENPPLLNGQYYVTPAIADEHCIQQFDYWKSAANFAVMDEKYSKYIFGEIGIRTNVKLIE